MVPAVAVISSGWQWVCRQWLPPWRCCWWLEWANAGWSNAVECEREFLLFRQALDNAVNSRVPPEPEQLTLRYDLFLSRLVLLRDGSAAAVLGERPEYQSAMPKLTQWAMAADAVMLQTPPDPRALAGLLVQVNALAADVSNLVTKTLGGTIGVNSTEGSGTTWSIDLPQVAPGGKA